MATLRELCQRTVYFIRADHSVREAARYMAERNVGAVAVLEGDRLSGIFSERDLLNRVVARGLDPSALRVSEVMTPNPVVVEVSESIEKCLRIMKQTNCRHLPVVEEGRLAGMLSMRDVLQMDIAEKADEIQMMRAYIHFVPPGTEE